MKLDNEFTVGVPIDQAWAVLTDLELIAPCMPGAQLTGVNDGIYTGKVKIKVGPVTAEYAGTAQFTEKDEAAHRAVIDARGRDSRGNGNANAVISANLQPDAGGGTQVSVSTDLTIAGRIAQFGSGMIKEVSAKLLGQFVDCLEGKLAGGLAASAGGEDQEASADAAGSASAKPSPAESTQSLQDHEQTPAPAAASATAPPAPAVAAAPEPAALDLMSVAGGAIYKRLVPLVIGLIVVAVIIWLIVR
jgi:uncharacterized protein